MAISSIFSTVLATALVRVGFRQWQLLEQRQCKVDMHHIRTVLTAAGYPQYDSVAWSRRKKLETSSFGTNQQGDVLKSCLHGLILTKVRKQILFEAGWA